MDPHSQGAPAGPDPLIGLTIGGVAVYSQGKGTGRRVINLKDGWVVDEN